jgi:hypothetical protein
MVESPKAFVKAERSFAREFLGTSGQKFTDGTRGSFGGGELLNERTVALSLSDQK